jgi:hypothetical protein
LDAGADKGAKDVEGNIPWHYASDELCQSLPELNPEVKQFESETFDAEREMSDILGYDVKLFHQVNKLIFLSPEQLQEWFEEEIEKDEPNWDLIEVLQSQHGIEFDYKNLHWAAEHNNIGLAKYLLGKGADKDAQSKILLCTPLHYAAIINSEAVAKLLIDAGADKGAKDNKGNTAWDLAGSKLRQSLPELNPDA